MLGDHVVGVSLFLVSNYLLSALVKVNVRENQVLDRWNVVNLCQIEVDLHASNQNLG